MAKAMPKKEFDRRTVIAPPGVELYSHLFVFKDHYVEKGCKPVVGRCSGRRGTILALISINRVLTIKKTTMPQKHHEDAAKHHDEAAKHHRNAADQLKQGKNDQAATSAQAAQGHAEKAGEHGKKAAKKYAQKAGTMKNEDSE